MPVQTKSIEGKIDVGIINIPCQIRNPEKINSIIIKKLNNMASELE